MSAGGYKCVSFSWGGRSDSALDRCQYVLHGFCSAIINANVGWEWDTDFNNGTIGDYKTMGGHTVASPNIAYILKLVYNNHTYRLCVGYNFKNITALREQDCVPFYLTNASSEAYYQFYGGLYCGYIKDGTFTYDSTYGYIPGNTGQFLKWMHFAAAGYNNSPAHSFACENLYNYTYFAILKGSQIIILYKSSQWDSSSLALAHLKGYMIGDIFKETAHSSDTNTFACIYLATMVTAYNKQAENSWPETGVSNESIPTSNNGCLINSSNGSTYFWKASGYGAADTTMSQIFTESGGKLEGTNKISSTCLLMRFDYFQVSSTVSAITGGSNGGRWTPCYVWYYSNDQQVYGVVPGDSFKGYLDTDLIRGVNPNYTYGQLLDDGKFIYLGGGFAVGWDSSNTVAIF